MTLRLGLTQRLVRDPRHGEPRDALAHDWAAALPSLLPGVVWCPLPNHPAAALDLVRAFALDGVVLTGGDDVGAAPARDATEHALLTHALAARLPVFGVCRGLQFIVHFLGGVLAPASAHAGLAHPVRLENAPVSSRALPLLVNSYHDNAIPAATLPADLIPFAFAPDDTVEGALHRTHRLGGIMWHPERRTLGQSAEFDHALLSRFFSSRP